MTQSSGEIEHMGLNREIWKDLELYYLHSCSFFLEHLKKKVSKLLNLSSLTCVCPHVGLEVGALEVGLAAVLMGTNMIAYTGHFWLQRGVSLL